MKKIPLQIEPRGDLKATSDIHLWIPWTWCQWAWQSPPPSLPRKTHSLCPCQALQTSQSRVTHPECPGRTLCRNLKSNSIYYREINNSWTAALDWDLPAWTPQMTLLFPGPFMDIILSICSSEVGNLCVLLPCCQAGAVSQPGSHIPATTALPLHGTHPFVHIGNTPTELNTAWNKNLSFLSEKTRMRSCN